MPDAHQAIVPPIQRFRTTTDLDLPLRILSSEDAPAVPYRIQHRGRWFYIDDAYSGPFDKEIFYFFALEPGEHLLAYGREEPRQIACVEGQISYLELSRRELERDLKVSVRVIELVSRNEELARSEIKKRRLALAHTEFAR